MRPRAPVYVTVIAAAFALSTAVTWVVDRNDNTLAGLGDATTARNGRIVDAEGDSMFAVFPRPADAVMAALARCCSPGSPGPCSRTSRTCTAWPSTTSVNG